MEYIYKIIILFFFSFPIGFSDSFCLSPKSALPSETSEEVFSLDVDKKARYLAFAFEELNNGIPENILREEFGFLIPNYHVFTHIIKKLYFSPFLYDTAEIMKIDGATREELILYYKIIQNSLFLKILFMKYSPHSNYFIILEREFRDNRKLEDIINGKFVFPQKIELHIGHRCPADCRFCYSRQLRLQIAKEMNRKNVTNTPFYPDELEGKRLLTLDDYKRIVDELVENNPERSRTLVLSGGAEPLSFKHLGEVVEYASSKKVRVHLYTNGIGFNGRNDMNYYRKFLSAGFIRLSLNAASKKTYIKQMNVDQFERVISNLVKLVKMKKLLGSKTEIRINFVIDKYNFKEILTAVDLAHNLGVDVISFRLPYNIPDALTAEEQKEVLYTLEIIRKKFRNGEYGKLNVMFPGFPFWGFDHLKKLGVIQLDKRHALFSPTITPFGNVVSRCILAQPENFNAKYNLGGVVYNNGNSHMLRDILLNYFSGNGEVRDDLSYLDASNITIELLIRYLMRERQNGVDFTEIPVKFNGFSFAKIAEASRDLFMQSA